MVSLARWVVAGLPRGWPGTAGPVGEARHGLRPRHRLAAEHDGPTPQFLPAVSARIHELFELAVRHLGAPDPERPQRQRRQVVQPRQKDLGVSAGMVIIGVGLSSRRSTKGSVRPADGDLERPVARLLQPEPGGARQPEAVQRGHAERPPARGAVARRDHATLTDAGVERIVCGAVNLGQTRASAESVEADRARACSASRKALSIWPLST